MISYFPMQGGENLLAPSTSTEPGMLQYSQNYECDELGRYRRIDGYERFDGQPSPSDAIYVVVDFDAGEGEISVGDIVDGVSGTGEVLVVTVESGAWGTSDAAGYLVLFNVTGYYVDNEDLDVSAVKKAVAASNSVTASTSDENYNTWIQAAIEATRDDISAVTGQGDILGVWEYKGVVYAFRNATGGATAKMYKSSSSGWTECSLGEKLSFNTGSVAFVAGETITQGGVTAVVRKIIVTSGTWGGADAAGYFTITGRSGGNFSAAGITGSIAGVANATGAAAENTLSPSGRYEFINYNFGGHAGTEMMYGCDGVNKAFEWDGTYFIFITTGMTTDTPKHIIAHENHLFLSFTGGSVQNSSIHDPYSWSVVTGASEIGMGDEVVGFLSMPKALMIFSRNKTSVLYGSSTSDFELRTLSDESGAIEWTIQKIGNGIYLDDRGLTSVQAVQDYGDFAYNSISEIVRPFIEAEFGNEIASIRIRRKNQYRLFYSDGNGLCLTLNKNKIIGFTRVLYSHTVTCCCSSEDSSGNEVLYFGGSNGYVYQLDKGDSFDGLSIQARLYTHFHHYKSPSNKKRFRTAHIDFSSTEDPTITCKCYFDNGETSDSQETLSMNAGLTLNSVELRRAIKYIDGSGTNLSFFFNSSTTYENVWTITGITVNYDVRGLARQ